MFILVKAVESSEASKCRDSQGSVWATGTAVKPGGQGGRGEEGDTQEGRRRGEIQCSCRRWVRTDEPKGVLTGDTSCFQRSSCKFLAAQGPGRNSQHEQDQEGGETPAWEGVPGLGCSLFEAGVWTEGCAWGIECGHWSQPVWDQTAPPSHQGLLTSLELSFLTSGKGVMIHGHDG